MSKAILVKRGVECNSDDHWYGKKDTVEECQKSCADARDCHFFIYGWNGTKKGDCYRENTEDAVCVEGWEEDSFDFYELVAPWIGCTEPKAVNYNKDAKINSGCTEFDACVEDIPRDRRPPLAPAGQCNQWRSWCQQPCKAGNEGYRNKEHDTVYASRVEKGKIRVDGDLREWATHSHDRCYKDVAFADRFGDEVIFETQLGGKYFGAEDFSISWMMAWDEDYLYLAADVADDVSRVSGTCYQNGLQAAFEVGGADSYEGGQSMRGALQAKRSNDLAISRLTLINVGQPWPYAQRSQCQTLAGNSSEDGRGCCVHYELNNGPGWSPLRLAEVAVLRNDNSNHTIFEVGFARKDLMPNAHGARWAEGLRFGFSFLVNDGDETSEQQGWAGYYPQSIVNGWNAGQKEPAKVGIVQFAGLDPPVGVGGAGGGGFGDFVLGVFVTLCVLGLGIFIKRWRRGQCRPTSGPFAIKTSPISSTYAPNSLAAADHCSSVLPTTTPLSSTYH